MNSANRDKINSTLIGLVKRHEILYNAKHANRLYFEDRRESWNKITKEMNRIFKTKTHAEEWKGKWREMRAYYVRSSEKTQHVDRRNPIYDELDFLQPYVNVSKGGKSRGSHTPKKSRVQNTVHDEKFHDVEVVGEGDDSYSTYQATNQPTTASFDITMEIDDDMGASEKPPVTNAVNALPDSVDDDGDKMFGMLIAEELRKMTPAAQKDFKRGVTRLLYT